MDCLSISLYECSSLQGSILLLGKSSFLLHDDSFLAFNCLLLGLSLQLYGQNSFVLSDLLLAVPQLIDGLVVDPARVQTFFGRHFDVDGFAFEQRLVARLNERSSVLG